MHSGFLAILKVCVLIEQNFLL